MKLLDKKDSNPRDPYVFICKNKYYCLFSQNNCLWMKVSDTLSGILNAEKHIVFVPDDEYCNCLWAPELHFFSGVPFIYYTASQKYGEPQHMFVLTTESGDILGPYKKISYLKHKDDAWAIDGTILKLNEKLYYIYSAFGEYDNEVYQALYICEMENPYTFKGEPHLLTKSEYDWEKHGCDGKKRPYVTEGPYALYHQGDTFVVYSASGCWTDYYCLGLLKYEGGDVLDSRNWKKYDRPILDNSSGFVGPGHASFIQNDPSGREYCAFHSYLTDSSKGEGEVSAHIFPFEWIDNIPKIKI
jgi:GH43 family beta-xylosidase